MSAGKLAMTNSTVSVIIPCYNGARFLSETIESDLAQTYPHFEVIVVNDGSIDTTEEVVSRYFGVRYIRQENQGVAIARNTGLSESHGAYVVFLDQEDRLLPNALEVGINCLKTHTDCTFVYMAAVQKLKPMDHHYQASLNRRLR